MPRTFQVVGLEDAKSALEQLGRRGANKVVSKAIRAGLTIIRKAEKANAPKLSGLTRRAIRSAVKTRQGNVKGTVAPRYKFFTDQTPANPKGKFYPGFIIFGFRKRQPKALGKRALSIVGFGGRVAPNDFVERTYAQTADAAANATSQMILEQLPDEF